MEAHAHSHFRKTEPWKILLRNNLNHFILESWIAPKLIFHFVSLSIFCVLQSPVFSLTTLPENCMCALVDFGSKQNSLHSRATSWPLTVFQSLTPNRKIVCEYAGACLWLVRMQSRVKTTAESVNYFTKAQIKHYPRSSFTTFLFSMKQKVHKLILNAMFIKCVK